MFVLLSVFYVCKYLSIICILCLYYYLYFMFYYLYFMFVLLSVFYVCILCLYYYLYFMFVSTFLLSVFYVCTYIFYTYIYCYVAIGEHWRRLFWSKVNISENCVFIFSLDFQLFPTFSEASFLADIFGPDGRICVKFWS